MRYVKEGSLRDFKAWDGAEETLRVVIERGGCDELEVLITEAFTMFGNLYGLPTETQINDYLRYESEHIYVSLGYDDLLD